MSARALIEVDFCSLEGARAVQEALSPESVQTSIQVKRRGRRLILEARAKDKKELRAILNSTLRLMMTVREVIGDE